MARKFFLEILWIAAQGNGFANIRTNSKEMVGFSNGWLLTKDTNIFSFKNFEDRENIVNIEINTEAQIRPDQIKVIKQFLSDEFKIDG